LELSLCALALVWRIAMATAKTPSVMSPKARREQIRDIRKARDDSENDHQAWASINRQLIDLEREDYMVKQEAKTRKPDLNPAQQNDALRAQVRTAPKSLRWDILQDILADNPDWVGDDTPDNVVPING
jgi:hypothetical protein